MSAAKYPVSTPRFIEVTGAGRLLYEMVCPSGNGDFRSNLLRAAKHCADWQQFVEGRFMLCRFSDNSETVEVVRLDEVQRIGLLVHIVPDQLQGYALNTDLCDIYTRTGMTMFRSGRLTLMLDTSARWWVDQEACRTIRLLREKEVEFAVDLSSVTTPVAYSLLQWLHQGGLEYLHMVRLPVFLHRVATRQLCAVSHIINLVMRSEHCIINATGVSGPDDVGYLRREGVACMQGDVLGYHQSGEQVMAAIRKMLEPLLSNPVRQPTPVTAVSGN